MNNQTLLLLGVGAFLLLRQSAKKEPTLSALNLEPAKLAKRLRWFSDLPAQEVNGKWLKYQNGTWMGLTKNETVSNIDGKYVVRGYGKRRRATP